MAATRIDQSEVVHYLLALGLVKPRDVIEEAVVVVDASRRNRVFVATVRGIAYVVKQARPADAATVSHEAALLRALARRPDFTGLVPAVVHEDADEGRVVLRTSAGARDWAVHHGTRRAPRLPARALGRVLAGLHRLRAADFDALPAGIDPMWGLALPEPSLAFVLELSAGGRDVVGRIQADRVLCERLERLRDARVDGALVHGDVRWDNCLAATAPGARRATRVLLIDWELAGRGDPAFDVGAVLAEYLRLWVGSIPIVTPSEPGRFAHRARHPLDDMQPAMAAFWVAYKDARGGRVALRAVVEMTAVRLLQSAVELADGLTSASAHVMTLVQLAANLLRDPDDAARGLLGLRE
jgi:aminoglycoside phosphotransferase (APT) family kinase protein